MEGEEEEVNLADVSEEWSEGDVSEEVYEEDVEDEEVNCSDDDAASEESRTSDLGVSPDFSVSGEDSLDSSSCDSSLRGGKEVVVLESDVVERKELQCVEGCGNLEE